MFSCGELVFFTAICFAALHAALATEEDPSLCDESCMLQSTARENKQPSCGWNVDCPQHYSIEEVSQARANVSEAGMKERLQKSHSACALDNITYLESTGGYCYATTNQRLISKDEHVIDQDYLLPSNYHVFDEGLAKAMSKLLFKDGESVTDLGAGVGQTGHALRAWLPKLDYRGYDGAGNVEEYTRGFVKFGDLTLPIPVEVSDWVMCLEVGEHIPHQFEKEVIQNLHALNRKGVFLSWAHLQQGGIGHVNCHSPAYIHNVFAALGYEYDNSTSQALRQSVTSEVWFSNNLMVFRRK